MSLVSLGMLIRRVAVIPVAALAIVVLLAGSAQAATYPNSGRVTGDIGVHDPSVVKSSGGTYLARTGRRSAQPE